MPAIGSTIAAGPPWPCASCSPSPSFSGSVSVLRALCALCGENSGLKVEAQGEHLAQVREDAAQVVHLRAAALPRPDGDGEVLDAGARARLAQDQLHQHRPPAALRAEGDALEQRAAEHQDALET